jgi:uncharacterized protein (TIGR02145 family)
MVNMNRKLIVLLLIVNPILFSACKNETKKIELPTIKTLSVTEITSFDAKSGGYITTDGGSEVTSRGTVWSTQENPSLEQHEGIRVEPLGAGVFQSVLTGLTENTEYFVRAFASNELGTGYGEQVQFKTVIDLPIVLTNNVISVSINAAMVEGNLINQGSTPLIERGFCWSKNPYPTTANRFIKSEPGQGVFTGRIDGLLPNTSYYLRAYASNASGINYGEQVQFTTNSLGQGEVYNSKTRRIWMDRNLGASRVARSIDDSQSYGDYYQWGRGADGHEKKFSETSTSYSYSDTPLHNRFILVRDKPYDWRSPQNEKLWQGVNGINNPCPKGFRLPTEEEWQAERQSWNSNNAAGAFNSPLKLPAAGFRSDNNGLILSDGGGGLYWASTTYGFEARHLTFTLKGSTVYHHFRAGGIPVRCIKD